MINGRWNGVEFLGVPLDLIVAGGTHAVAFMGIAPKHLHNFGDGALASYSTVLGAGIGRKMAISSGAPGAGYLPGGGSGYAPLSDAQLADLASHA